jgi:ABC-type transport system substrate-binding protein
VPCRPFSLSQLADTASSVGKVGDDAFKKAPVGAGPYKFVSFTPGVELVMEAFDGYCGIRDYIG